MRKTTKLLLPFLGLIITGLLGIQGCKRTSQNQNPDTQNGRKLTVGVVFDSGGLGDKSFNDSANVGLQKAKKVLGIRIKEVQSASAKDYQSNLQAMAQAGCSLIFAVGLNQEDALLEVAPKYPHIDFAIVDGTVAAPNVRSLHFAAAQGSFLAGYLAGLVTKTNKLGFVGGEDLDLIKEFYVGFVAGAKTANPKVIVFPAKYVGDWDNTDTAHAEALQLYGSGADIVYHAAGRAGLGVIAAAKEQQKYAIGVDSDQDYLAPGYVLTSMVKHVDEAVFQTIKDVQNKEFTSGVKVYDLKSNGVGLSPMTYTKARIGASNIAKVEVIRKEIIAGKILVPSTPAQLRYYLSSLENAGH